MARWTLQDGRIVQGGQPFEYDGNLYPANFMQLATPEERQDIGAVEIIEDPRPDETQNWVSEDPENPGKWIATPKSAEQLAPMLKAKVNAIRDQRLIGGYADAVTGKTYQCDPVSQTKWTAVGASAGLALALGSSPAPTFEIIAADNSIVELTTLEALALMQERVMPWVSATMLYARTLKDAIDAGNPPEDVSADWP